MKMFHVHCGWFRFAPIEKGSLSMSGDAVISSGLSLGRGADVNLKCDISKYRKIQNLTHTSYHLQESVVAICIDFKGVRLT